MSAINLRLLCLVGALLWLCAWAGVRTSNAGETLTVESEELVLVDGVDLKDRLVGRVASARRAQLGFERGGRIASVAVRMGERVTKGQELAVLDLRQLQAQRREIEARLRAARADLQRIRAQLDLAVAVRKRQDDLFSRGVAAAQEHDEAVFGERALRAQVSAGEAAIAASEAARDTLDVSLELSRLIAPFAGTVTQRLLDEGSVVSPGAPVLLLIDREREVRIGVPLAKLAGLRIGKGYSLYIEGRQSAGTLLRLVDSVDPTTRTVEAVFSVDGDVAVVDGAIAYVLLSSRIESSGFWVPTAALTEGRRGLWSVFVLHPEGERHRIERRDVSVIHARPDRTFVRGTLSDGELIAVDGVHRIVPGQLVDISLRK